MPRVKAAASRSRKLVQVRYNNGDNVGIINDDDTSSEDEEQTQIKDLCKRLPQLDNIFHIHSKIGEGTFSTVYLGSLKQHDLLPDSEKRWYAIKHLVPTAHPARVEHELRCLRELGGKHNVINVELCLRNLDNVVFIMPYIPHRKFSELIVTFTATSLREYLRALTSALRHVHARGVIHRDVKPSNFLYDPISNRYQLIDFGLAQRIESLPSQTAKVSVQRAPLGDKLTNLPEREPSGAERRPSAPEHAANGTENVLRDGASRTQDVGAKLCNDKPMKRPREEEVVLPEAKRIAVEVTSEASRGRDHNAATATKCVVPPCGCWGRGGVCRGAAGVSAGAGAGAGAGCAGRPPARAPRAGTQGFRPPEVLLKYTHQTTAVDMWALGVVSLSGACARYPLLRARDDAHALAELCALLGHRALAHAAANTGRRLVVSRACAGVCLRRLCARLRGVSLPPASLSAAAPRDCAACRPHACVCKDPNVDPAQFDPHGTVAGFPDSLFSLLHRLLDPDPHTRISADEALQHPFFTEP